MIQIDVQERAKLGHQTQVHRTAQEQRRHDHLWRVSRQWRVELSLLVRLCAGGQGDVSVLLPNALVSL